MSKSVYYYKSLLKDHSAIEQALQQKVEAHSEEGFWKTYDRLPQEGKPWNHKRVYRVYAGLGLPLRRKKRNAYQLELKNL